MATKKEKEEMRKALKSIDNKWEALAYMWTYRQREFLFYLNVFQSNIIIFMLLRYTGIIKFILSFFGNGGSPE